MHKYIKKYLVQIPHIYQTYENGKTSNIFNILLMIKRLLRQSTMNQRICLKCASVLDTKMTLTEIFSGHREAERRPTAPQNRTAVWGHAQDEEER